MVDRLAQFLDASVVLLDAEGEPEIVAGKPPVDELLQEVCAEPPGLVELEVDGWHAVATPVATRADQADALARAGEPAPRASSTSSPSRPRRRRRRCSPRWRGSVTSCATRSRRSRPRCSRRRSSRSSRATCRRWPRAPPRSGSTSPIPPARGDRCVRAGRAAARLAASRELSQADADPAPRAASATDSLTALVQGDDARSRALGAGGRAPGRARSASAARSPRSTRSTTRCATPSSPSAPRRPDRAADHALRGLRPRHVHGQRDRARAARPEGRRDPLRAAREPAAARGAEGLLRPRPRHRRDRRVAAHAPQLAALPARARRAGARPLAQAAVDDRGDLHRARREAATKPRREFGPITVVRRAAA